MSLSIWQHVALRGSAKRGQLVMQRRARASLELLCAVERVFMAVAV